MQVDYLKYVRGEVGFRSCEELDGQIALDIDVAQDVFKKEKARS